MKFDWKKAVFIVVALAVAFALYKVLGAEQALSRADLGILVFAQLLFFASIVFWNAAWASRAKIGAWEANLAGFSSLAGMLTPMGVGSDFLRTFFGRHLHKDAGFLLATSFAVKLYKMALAAVLLFILFPFVYGAADDRLKFSLLAGAAIIVAGIVFIKFASGRKFGFLKYFGEFGEKAAGISIHLKTLLSIPPAGVALPLFASLFFEFAAFYSLFAAFGLQSEWQAVLASFLLLFFASKMFLPYGFGVVEALGFFLFQNQFELSAIAGLLLAWDAVRAWVPAATSALFVFARRKKI